MFPGVNASPLLTAEDVERTSVPGKQVELVRGRLVVREPPGTWHGAIAARLTCLLGDFVHARGLGVVFAQDTGFQIASDPDTVRAPDVAFVARERADRIPRRGYAVVAPDLLAEGVEVRVYRQDGSLSVLHASDSLEGEDVLPGFACPLMQVLL